MDVTVAEKVLVFMDSLVGRINRVLVLYIASFLMED
jgi:hypothetical protein